MEIVTVYTPNLSQSDIAPNNVVLKSIRAWIANEFNHELLVLLRDPLPGSIAVEEDQMTAKPNSWAWLEVPAGMDEARVERIKAGLTERLKYFEGCPDDLVLKVIPK